MVSVMKVGWKQRWLGGNLDTSKDLILDAGTCVMNNALRGYGRCSFKYNQQDATLYNILYYCQSSTCFRRFLYPSSGAQKLYIQHLVYVKLPCCYR